MRSVKQSPVLYEIQVEGYLDSRWSDWFGGMELTNVETDGGLTILTGSIPDQSALHGFLAKIRDLGLVLVSVRRIDQDFNQGEFIQNL